MFSNKPLLRLFILGIIFDISSAALIEPDIHFDRNGYLAVTKEESRAEHVNLQNNDRLFPIPLHGDEKFLLLNPDEKSPADFQRLLPIDQHEINRQR